MSTFDREILADVAFAKVTGTTGVATMNRGFKAIARTGAGVYTLEREPATSTSGVAGGAALANSNVIAHVTPQGATPRIVSTEDTTTVITTVRTVDAAGSPIDADFTITICCPTNR